MNTIFMCGFCAAIFILILLISIDNYTFRDFICVYKAY
jgi:hypothetical protein